MTAGDFLREMVAPPGEAMEVMNLERHVVETRSMIVDES
jgi:hypothetical protein